MKIVRLTDSSQSGLSNRLDALTLRNLYSCANTLLARWRQGRFYRELSIVPGIIPSHHACFECRFGAEDHERGRSCSADSVRRPRSPGSSSRNALIQTTNRYSSTIWGRSERLSYGKHMPHLLTESLGWHSRYLLSGCHASSGKGTEEQSRIIGKQTQDSDSLCAMSLTPPGLDSRVRLLVLSCREARRWTQPTLPTSNAPMTTNGCPRLGKP